MRQILLLSGIPVLVFLLIPASGIASTVTVQASPGGKGLQLEVDGNRITESGTFTWEAGSSHNIKAVTPQLGNDSYLYTFERWSDGGAEFHSITPQGDGTYTAYFTGEPTTVSVRVSVSPQGKGLQVEVDGTRYAESQSFTWQKGSGHTLTAVSPQNGNDDYRYTYDHWSDAGADTHSVTVQGDGVYTVYYTGEPYTFSITVAVSPQGKGLQVEVDGTRYTESKSFTWQKGSGHTLKAITPQIGNDTYRYTFDHWSDGGAGTHSVTVNQDSTYTVYYTGESTNVAVTVSVSPQGKGLQVEVDGTRYVESKSFTWQKGSGHTLKAVTPQIGNDSYRYNFDHWSDAGAETHSVTVQGDGVYTVYYVGEAASVSATVSVSPQGKGLQVEVDGTRYTETKSFTWQKGSGHTLKAVTPQIGNDSYRYNFDHWSDAGAETHSVTVNQDGTYTVFYTGESITVAVTVSVSPQGKGLQMEVDGTRYVESKSFTWQKGSAHTLKAVTPQIGNDTYRYTFDHWGDAGATTHSVTVNQDATYTVYYTFSGATVWNVNLTLGPTSDEITLTWSSIPSESYSIFYSYDLVTWQLADGNVPSAGDQTTSWVDNGTKTGVPPSLVRFRFYRVMENP